MCRAQHVIIIQMALAILSFKLFCQQHYLACRLPNVHSATTAQHKIKPLLKWPAIVVHFYEPSQERVGRPHLKTSGQ